MKKIFFFLFSILFSCYSFSQVYSLPDNSYGKQFRRGKFDSTLHIPTISGSPVGNASLKDIVYKNQSAIVFDSTNKVLWVYSPKDSVWVKALSPTSLSSGTDINYNSSTGVINNISTLNSVVGRDSVITGTNLVRFYNTSGNNGIQFYNSPNNNGYYLGFNNGTDSSFTLNYDGALGIAKQNIFKFSKDGTALFYGNLTASSLIKSGGTASQFLKADGSVDATAYLPLTGGTLTGNIMANNFYLPTYNTLNSTSPYQFSQYGNTDFWKVYLQNAGLDLTEMVFQLGDNGSKYNDNGERWRFNYDNSGSGVAPKDVLIIDYDTSYFYNNIKVGASIVAPLTSGSSTDSIVTKDANNVFHYRNITSVSPATNLGSSFSGLGRTVNLTSSTGTGTSFILPHDSLIYAGGANISILNSNTITLTNIPNSSLQSSTISSISLGGNLNTLTFGTHLTGTSYNGSAAVTLGTDATSANTASTIVARDASGNFIGGAITAISFIKSGGTSSQFLKADGSIDGNTYLLSSNISGSTNYISKFNSANSLVNSIAKDSSGVFSVLGKGNYSDTLFASTEIISTQLKMKQNATLWIGDVNGAGAGAFYWSGSNTYFSNTLSAQGYASNEYSANGSNVLLSFRNPSSSTVVAQFSYYPSTTDMTVSDANGFNSIFRFYGGFAPTAGTVPGVYFNMSPTINATGTYTGTIRGIYYNPVLTSVLGTHIAFENTSGSNYFNSTSGNTGIGYASGAVLPSKLSVNGTATFSSSVILSNTSNIVAAGLNNISSIATLTDVGTALNAGAAISANASELDYTSSASRTIGNSNTISGGLFVNRPQISGSSTITISQGATGKRSLSGLTGVVSIPSTAASTSTISDVASLRAFLYADNSANLYTITNYYGLLIGNSTEFVPTNITNRYGIYQDGISDINYFNGNIIANGGVSLKYTSQTTTYSIATTDYTVDCSGTFTVTLPTAVGVSGKVYVIKNSGTGTITIACTSTQTIDGSTTKTLSTQYGSLMVQSNGANWLIIN